MTFKKTEKLTSKPRWILFDVGGVIFDYVSAFCAIAQYLKVSEEFFVQQIFQTVGPGILGQITFDEELKNALKHFDQVHEHQKVLSLWWDKKWFVSDTLTLIKELKLDDYKLAIFTNNWMDMAEKIYSLSPEIQSVHKRFESSKEKLYKPDIKFYELVESKTCSSDQNIFFIDDTRINLDTARLMNWQTFHYALGNDNGKTSNDKIRSLLLKS